MAVAREVSDAPPDAQRHGEFAFAASLCVFTFVFFANAWVGDDAYITLRTIDNFVNGYGLRWNVIERVQVYTHPLWMLLLSVPYYVTGEAYYTVIAVSYMVCLAAILVYKRGAREGEWWNAALFVAVLLSSKSFMDYSSSGLENCLSALWGISFVIASQRAWADRAFPLWRPLMLASLAYVTRQDTVLIYAPSCVLLIGNRMRHAPRKLWRDVTVGAAPAVLWTTFALIYYGFLLPNTAYAKAFVSGITLTSRAKQGVAYVLTTGLWDPFLAVMLMLFLYVAMRTRRAHPIAIAAGVALYVTYIVVVAATSSVMGLRFFTTPLIVAAALLVLTIDAREAVVVGLVAATFTFIAPLSPLRTLGCSWSSLELPAWGNSAIIDVRARGCHDGYVLANFQRNERLPRHAWYTLGVEFRQTPERVRWGGPMGLPAMGYFGYAAGADKIIVDPYGLTDALVARLPAAIDPLWIPGEIARPRPEGYLESVQSGSNVIADESLREYYESLRTVTSGPLFSIRRWKEIVVLNLGWRDHLLREYAARQQRQSGGG